MKNKATLTLMELAVMLLVFSLAAAFCLRAFVWADETSGLCANRDRALVQVQNAAEVLKACGGDVNQAAGMFGGSVQGNTWSVRYDEGWEQVEADGEYLLVVRREPSGMEYLFTADVRVLWEEDCLVQLDVAGQEVSSHG